MNFFKEMEFHAFLKKMKLEEVKEEPTEKVVIPKSENIGTNLGDLFKNIQL